MTKRQTALIGSVTGLVASSVFLLLLWFGVSGVLRIGNANLRYVLWPSSIMLVRGWCCTVPGIMITLSSVAFNCLTYAALALLSRTCASLLFKRNTLG